MLTSSLLPLVSPLLLRYGLYFGILGRDCAEVAADRMAAGLGAGPGGRRGLISSIDACGICGNHLNDRPQAGQAVSGEEVVQLSCKVRPTRNVPYLPVWVVHVSNFSRGSVW